MSRVFSAAAVFSVVACATTDSSSGAGDPWQQALRELATSTGGVYSFRFDGAPPSGAFYTLAIHGSADAIACSRYSGAEPGEFWYLDLGINDLALGEHAIGVAQRNGAASGTANITLLHRKAGAFVEAYAAVAGTVNLRTAPHPEEAAAGARFEGTIEADFPLLALREVVCEGGGVPGGTVSSTCTCMASNGVKSTCVPGPDGANCCHDLTGPRTHVSIPFAAAPCTSMCRWAAGIPNYCQDYFTK